jgi:hypothetical protein
VAISQGVKWLKLEANHPPTPKAQIKEQFPYMPLMHPQGQFYPFDRGDFSSSFLQKLLPVIRLQETDFIGK